METPILEEIKNNISHIFIELNILEQNPKINNSLNQIVKIKELLFFIEKKINQNSNKILLKEKIENILFKCSGFTVLELIKNNKSRNREYVLPRQIHMTLLCTAFYKTSKEAGKIYFKDHSTVLFAIKTVRNLLETNSSFRKQYAPLFIFAYLKGDKYNMKKKLNPGLKKILKEYYEKN